MAKLDPEGSQREQLSFPKEKKGSARILGAPISRRYIRIALPQFRLHRVLNGTLPWWRSGRLPITSSFKLITKIYVFGVKHTRKTTRRQTTAALLVVSSSSTYHASWRVYQFACEWD